MRRGECNRPGVHVARATCDETQNSSRKNDKKRNEVKLESNNPMPKFTAVANRPSDERRERCQYPETGIPIETLLCDLVYEYDSVFPSPDLPQVCGLLVARLHRG